ncbi:hypothetical protein CLV58_115151 [Spirosoma oryzae]|uniref:KOW motif-containing protein n=1 Tax=Spirosoma oryzae TaxID=1469603 RepID=A0A2T0SNR7_9BACT|nr:hypothetical protein [Spirosoma oryzae]PRY35068.1 hypothetical protein CLV58_115151 [Spirosoma oryzae]
MKQLTSGSRVKVSVYKNGFFVNSYTGSVIAFTKTGLVKVKPDSPMAGIKCVSADNVKVIAEAPQ